MPVNLFITPSTFSVLIWYFVALFVVVTTRQKSTRLRRIAHAAVLVLILLGYSNMFTLDPAPAWLIVVKAGCVVALVTLAVQYHRVSWNPVSDAKSQPPTHHENH
jgi:energy-coupling factor transporter transmembrane protein EcfT